MKKHIIITGAGSGIGRSTAIELSKVEDHSLILVGRTKSKLTETKELLNNKEHHYIFDIDITKKGMLTSRLNEIPEINLFGLFANAGIGGENTFGEGDRWDEIIDINLNGTYFSIMESLDFMKSSSEKYKNIVITSSCLARFGVPNYTAYCTSKAGLLGLTKALAVEYASENILVNSICPGWVETEMAKQGIQLLADRNQTSYEEMYAMQMDYVPTKRMSQPIEIAKLVKFLICNEEISITGQGLDINNGAYMV